jgi:hypothetical protein
MITTCNSLVYHYIIIGGGLAGLYAYEKLKQKNHSLNILLLEKNNYLGGRMKEQQFHGTTIQLGAGIVDETCFNMLRLLDEYNIPHEKTTLQHIDKYLPPFDMNAMIDLIKDKYAKETNSQMHLKTFLPFHVVTTSKRLSLTVDQFLKMHFSEETIKLFYLYADFSDFHNQDINDFMASYPIDDLSRRPMKICSFKFADLINQLASEKNIVLNCEVKSIKKIKCGKPEQDIFSINDYYHCYNVITATTVNCLKQLFNFKFLDEIKSIPFYRKYVYSDNLEAYDYGMLMAKNEIKKMIKLTDNVIMIVYCDNKDAQFWCKVHEEEKKNSKLTSDKVLLKLLKENDPNLKLDILDTVHQYWDEGIHYYTPVTMDREKWIISHMNPEPGVYVIGEMMGIKQGWMEAAVESVVLLFEHKKI